MDDDQLSYRDSLDLSSQSATLTDVEQDTENDPDRSGPPDKDTEAEEDLSASLAELNVNQSNNNFPFSSFVSLSGLPLSRLCGKKLPLTRNRDNEPEFV